VALTEVLSDLVTVDTFAPDTGGPFILTVVVTVTVWFGECEVLSVATDALRAVDMTQVTLAGAVSLPSLLVAVTSA